MAYEMWGLTCFFNPCGWRSRRENFEIFRKALQVPLVVVEWSQTGTFELEEGSDLKVVHVDGGSTLWQKERLLNLGIQAIPDGCTHVAIVDSDLVFEHGDWPEQVVSALGNNTIIQPFSQVCHLPPEIRSDDFLIQPNEPAYLSRCEGLGYALSVEPNQDYFLAQLIGNQAERFKVILKTDSLSKNSREAEDINAFSTFPIATPGLAWCCSRDTLRAIGSIPDRFIAGGGDLFLMLGLLGRGKNLLDACKAAGLSYVDHHAYRQFCDTEIQHTLGALPQRVFHLHHGSLSNRRYDARHAALQRLNINLDEDLKVEKSGLLGLQGDNQLILEQHMRHYFQERKDDDDYKTA